MSNKEQPVQCPFHKGVITIDPEWATKNGRVFCNSCCKSFEVRVEQTEEPTPIEEEIKQKFDEGVKEILKDEVDEEEVYDFGTFWSSDF